MASYVRAMLSRLARRAGIEKRVYPHGLRRAHAVELAQERFPVKGGIYFAPPGRIP